MAAMTMEREPEVAGFMEQYKYDQQMLDNYKRFGGGTSLPLNSDGLNERRQKLKDELHVDWMKQQEKPPPKYYRVGTPEVGLPGLGGYEEQRKKYDLMRQRDFHAFQDKQRKLEQERAEARMRRSPPRMRPPQAQMDYNQQQEMSKASDKKAYQDYRKQKQERELALRGRPVTPPGGLDIGQYDRQVKEEAKQKKETYRAMLEQQKDEQLRLRAWDRIADISPAHVRARDEERPLVGSPRDINNYFQEQKQEHMFLRARQEPEVPVFERNMGNPPPLHAPPHLASKPPSGHGHMHRHGDLAYWNEGRRSKGPDSYDSEGSRQYRPFDYQSDIPLAFRTKREEHGSPSQQQNYGQPPFPGEGEGARNPSETSVQKMIVDNKLPASPAKPLQVSANEPNQTPPPVESNGVPLMSQERKKHDEIRHQAESSRPTAVVKNAYYGSEEHEAYVQSQKKLLGNDYVDYLDKDNSQKKDYRPRREWNYGQGGMLELRGDDAVQSRQRELKAERKKEYNERLDKQRAQEAPRRHEYIDPNVGPYNGGLFTHFGEHGHSRERLQDQRKQDYNASIRDTQRPTGRPKWAQEPLPNLVPNYDLMSPDPVGGRRHDPEPRRHEQDPRRHEQDSNYDAMLQEKRREESERRRFDPEYAPGYDGHQGHGHEGQYRQGF